MISVVREIAPAEESEKSLARRAVAGDRAAAEEIAERTYEMVYASLFRMCGGDADLAADLTQETYRRAWQSLASFRGGAKISTWLYRIAYTTFLNHIRRPREVVAFEESGLDPASEDAPAVDELMTAQTGTLLRDAVMALPEKMRYVVTAHYWGEVSLPQIAKEEGVSAVAIRKRLRKALERLQDDMKEVSS